MNTINDLIVAIYDDLKLLEVKKDNGTMPASTYYRKKKRLNEFLKLITYYQANYK